MLFIRSFLHLGFKKHRKYRYFWAKKRKNAIRTRFFARCAKNHGIYSVFCTWPFKNIGIYNVFATFHVVVFQHKNCKKHCILQCFALWNLQKNASKIVQKPSPKAAFSDPCFFGEFPWFFDNFLIPPRSPKNAKTPAVWRILVKIHFSPNWKPSRCKNAPKCRRERRFLRWLSKNIERGGVGGTASTPGSKLALATLLARHRRTAPATQTGAADQARRQVLRLPRRQEPRPSGDQARRNPFWRLQVLRLPCQRWPGAPQPVLEAPSIAPATQTGAAAQRRPGAPQPFLEALKRSRGPAATRRAATLSRGSEYCACHTDRSRGPAATRRAATACHTERSRGPAATRRAATLSRRSEYCACHTDRSRGPAATRRAATFSRGSEYCACHTDRSRGPAATRRAATLSRGSEYCAHTDGSNLRWSLNNDHACKAVWCEWDDEMMRWWRWWDEMRGWDGEMMRWWDGEMMRWWDDEMMKWWDDEMMRWWDEMIVRWWFVWWRRRWGDGAGGGGGGGEGGGGGGGGGLAPKNKNPTQRCGEKSIKYLKSRTSSMAKKYHKVNLQ